jgi:hypothetical protein
MSCGKDLKPCEANSLQCHLNPADTNPTYRDLGDGTDRPFFNKKCSNFQKADT